MRTCKACGGTKPLEKGFNAVPRKEGGLLLQIVQTCRNKAVRQKRAEKRAAAGAGAMTAARLHGYIRAAHAACPILGAGLWTQPAGECA
ncbi:putative phage associated protein [Neisseria gonorrhoeae]|uniref:Putative phage associated protein n=1 Tax=Neisseria gonorrhoeae TaxID=485 RepID=A0A378VX82_NEIGO|nr:putative phage associated protein [Neisseria gonorrhoeae]